ncbi:FG-GAP repeat domain-containing protein [Mucilaginibacter psychrotolerans]|uniref:VCBS repeat-containing protein n=1 Tax=Mucilaginibacter psychrotolerans TaxID=1524096 RepID=A0A4Y8SKE9_9SPHI|nr:VCBS repeat-containing protein [Mucilaginibacter psychrotolerans]TFF38904.1 VCBS repeat-containing protein [Mucilaginibacter psychrotolerans]
MGWRGFVLAVCFSVTLFISLNSFTNKRYIAATKATGPELFARYCNLCHMQPDVQSLTKEIWKNHVLPIMASRMGIIYPNYDPLRGLSDEEKDIIAKHDIIPATPIISKADWDKLENYIVSNAPDSILYDEKRLTRNIPLTQFTRKNIQIDEEGASLITGLKYNIDTKTLWIGNAHNKVINWQYQAGITKNYDVASTGVDFNFYQNHTYLTEIGKLYPTELSTGSYAQLVSDAETPLLTNLHRPVHSAMEDLNGDGIPEIVVCNFGNKTGSLSLFKKNKADGTYKEDILLPMPGAIMCYVKDMDSDGKKDIVAMFSQGDESVYIFYQQDNLKFKPQRVLRFPPNYGTTDMVLTDYNHDGLTDIVTVHGDNADYSNILKPYHGIRLNINKGNDVFEEAFFYPIYGVTKVLAEDFDNDGDIDLAASAFFPDFGRLLNESFVYLENTDSKAYRFKSYTLSGGLPIKSLTIEKADVDGDGDIDIILGNFAQTPGAVPPTLDKRWKSAQYGLILLENQLLQPKI